MPEPMEIRKFMCQCFCTWFMPTGIEPEFCPSCGGQVSKVEALVRDDPDAIGYYEED